MPLRVASIFKTTTVIDGEIIPIAITRLNPDQAVQFNQDFSRMARAATKAVPDNETPDQRAARELAAEEAERAAKKFLATAIGDYVAVEAGHIFVDDAQESITKGDDLVRLFGSRDDVLSDLLMQIFMENRLNAEQKANWRVRFAPFVPTPVAVATRMMELASVTEADTVVDIGCGSGRLCIAAAKRGARAYGYDIDADRIGEAREHAEKEGVGERCVFEQKDGMTVDVSHATVMALYLLSGANAKLRPVLLQQLPDGARVVSHGFAMGGDWIADSIETVPLGDGEKLDHAGQRVIYLYSVDRWRKPRLKK